MAKPIAANGLHIQAHALTSAENHIGELIATVRLMQEMESIDVFEAQENCSRFMALEAALADERPELAGVARDGADLEKRQIARNQQLMADQAALIGILTAIAGGINRVRQFAHRMARAVSDFLA